METMVCTVGMTADAQWQESGRKELNPCQYSPFEHHLECVCVALKSVIAMFKDIPPVFTPLD